MNKATIALVLLATACAVSRADEPSSAGQSPATAASRLNTPTPYSAPIEVPSAAGQIRLPPVPAPQIRVQPPAQPTFSSSCDSTGCWDSDGKRYDSSSGSLLRSDGRSCQNLGGVMQCQ
ncbi:MAG: hypothetical protein ABI343_07890 [Burkholderiaceae bacterium]